MNESRIETQSPLSARLLAIFWLSALLFGAIAHPLVSSLKEWSFNECASNSTPLCAATSAVVAYWWLAAIPSIAAMTYLGSRLWRRERHPGS